MHVKYEVVKGIKPVDMQDESLLAESSYETWWRIKDTDTHDPLPGGFESLEAANACCHDLNQRRA